MTDPIDDRIRRIARDARREIEGDVDVAAGIERLSSAERGTRSTPTPLATGRRRGLAVGGAVAAIAVGVVGGIVLLDGSESIETVAPADTTVPPATTAAVPPPPTSGESPATVDPATEPTTSTTSATPGTAPAVGSETTAPAIVEPGDRPFPCLGDESTESVAAFADAVAAERATGDTGILLECLGGVPDGFTGAPPQCWSDCAGFTQSMVVGAVTSGQSGTPEGGFSTDRSFALYVSYRRGDEVIDTAEGWRFEVTDSGLEFRDVGFFGPISTREEAVETLTTYLDHVRAGRWLEVAAMLDDGAINPDERPDLARLDLDDFSLESIAAALQTWCADGCVTDVPAPADLIWDGLYGIPGPERGVRVAWFEGQRSILGLPLRASGTSNLEEVSWRDLRWEDAGLERDCVDDVGCTQTVVGTDGSTVTYEPATRTMTREGNPPVETTLPDSYGDRSFLYASVAGVAYLGVESDEAHGDTIVIDVVAVALDGDEAGRELSRSVAVDDLVGDRQLVGSRDGLVHVNCCGPDRVRPAVDAEVVVPWVDLDGRPTSIDLRPVMRVEIDFPTLTVRRENVLPNEGTHEWEVELGDDWQPRGMPQIVPTFDGGFIVSTFGSRGTTVTRGWATGTWESVLLTDVFEIALDPSGRFVVPDGDRFRRVDPFPGRTWIWAGRPEVDFETGELNLPGIDDLAPRTDWGHDPIAFAAVVAGEPDVNEQRTISLERDGADTFVATVTTSNLFDDSVDAVRHELTLERFDGIELRFVSGRWSQACQPGRGHQDFSTQLCT